MNMPLNVAAALLIAYAALAHAQQADPFSKAQKLFDDITPIAKLALNESDTSAVPKLEPSIAVFVDLFMKAEKERKYMDKQVAQATEQRKQEAQAVMNITAEKEAQAKYEQLMMQSMVRRKMITEAMYKFAGGDGFLDFLGNAQATLMDVALENMQKLTGVEPDQAPLVSVLSKAETNLAMLEKQMKDTNDPYLKENMNDEIKFLGTFNRLDIVKAKKEGLFTPMALQFAGPLVLQPKAPDIKEWYKAGNCCTSDCNLRMVAGPKAGQYELRQ